MSTKMRGTPLIWHRKLHLHGVYLRFSECILDLSALKGAITIVLQDPDSFSEVERLPVVLFDEHTKNIQVGEKVIVEGDIQIIPSNIKETLSTYVYAKSIQYENREVLTLKQQDIEAIERFAKLNGTKVIDKLASMFAPSIIGYNHVKEGLLLCAANTGIDTTAKRNRINVLLIGDPGLAKSPLLREATKLVPNSRYESSQNSSGKSLTAIVAKEEDNYILRLGPASLAKGAFCAINEIGRMSYEDQGHLLDIAEEGEFTINKHGINARIRASTTIIASVNPVNNSTWNNKDIIDFNEIPAIRPLIDRFDLLYVYRMPRDSEENRKYAYKRSYFHGKKIPDYSNFLRKYILYSKRRSPTLSDDAKSMLNEYWVKLASEFGSRRILETLFRLASAISRLKLKEIIDEEDARETMEFYNAVLLQYQLVVKIPHNPRDVTYNECVTILKENNQAITIEELVKMASERNEQVESYLCGNFKMSKNWKIRPVLKMLINHDCIKQKQQKPIVLQWIDLHSKNEAVVNSTVCDANDVYDEEKNHNNESNKNYYHGNTSINTSHTSYTSHSLNLTRANKESIFECYYCDNFHTNMENDYLSHGAIRHPRKPMFPSKTDLKKYGLTPQWKRWESL